VGNPQFVADDSSGTATLIVPRSTFGTVGPGWVFTVALTGQGAGSPPVRDFQSTPQDYSFGVCPSATDTNPICKTDPNSVPKVIDTVPPKGVAQSTELDPRTPPVQLHGVTVP
jgi:glucoamylase